MQSEPRLDELVHGATRLMGGAKAIDLALFMNFFESWVERGDAHAQRVESYLQQLVVPSTTRRPVVDLL